MARHELALHYQDLSKRMKAYVRRETKTEKKALEERRDRLQARIGLVGQMIEVLHDEKSTEETKAKTLNLCSVYGMLGLMEGVAFLADCVTTRVYLKKKDQDGKKTKIPVRYTVAMTAEDIAGAAIDTATLADAVTKIVRDQVLMTLDPTKKDEWFDENGILRCPHYKEEEGGDEDIVPEEEIEQERSDETDEERKNRIEQEERGLLDKLTAEYTQKRNDAK